MTYLKKLNTLLGMKPRFKVCKVDNVYRAEIVIDGKHFVYFDDTAPESIENAAKMAVYYIDPNNWVDDSIWD